MEELKLSPIPKDLLFALDIGTRNVVGTIARKIEDTYEIIDYEVLPHPDRAMFDGQIHDIEKVTQVVKRVVAKLEDRNGFRLEKAAIAAAGRALKTEKASAERDIDFTKEIDKALTDSLEMEAIQWAQKSLTKLAHKHANYYCVGYSVTRYHLDGSLIMNPVGHKGSNIQVEVIATFLPHIVVDSLYAVIHKSGLEVLNLTLEPIAAMNVTIPQNLRLLNLALVDIGAGTSDIAISRDGTVESYGMVAVAGDKITEKLAEHYLLDFNTAETLKINLLTGDEHHFVDILGMKQTVSTESVIEIITPAISEIATRVVDQIMMLNKKAPSAVFCIGGGSQMPLFMEHISEALSLPKERVALKTVEQLEHVRFLGDPLMGPEFITPIGIGITAFAEREHDFIQVSVNDNILRLFNAKALRVSDALIIAGITARSLLAERGPSIEISLDGNSKTIRGEFGEPAKIYINGMIASLDSSIGHKDQITIDPATKGTATERTLGEVVRYDASVDFRGQKIPIIETVNVNGVNRTGDYLLKEGDVVITKGIHTIRELCQAFELDPRTVVFTKNGVKSSLEATLNHGETIDYEVMPSGIQTDDLVDDFTDVHKDVTDKGSLDLLKSDDNRAFEDPFEKSMSSSPESDEFGNEESLVSSGVMTFTVNGETVTVEKHFKQMVFVDIFNHIDFDISEAKGILMLKLNGERARYTDVLKNGDVIDIGWTK